MKNLVNALINDNAPIGILIRYASRQFFTRLLAILLGLSALLLTFDIAANADELLEHHDDLFTVFADYTRLRAPAILSMAVPFCVLLAMMSIFARMARHQEMIALRSAGISIYHTVTIFAVSATIVALLHFLFANLVVPSSQKNLRAWADQDYRGAPSDSAAQHDPRWIAAGPMMIYVGSVQSEGYVLRDVDVIERQDNGKIKNYFEIVKATYNGHQWDVLTSDDTRMSLELPFQPESFEHMETQVGDMSYGALMRAAYEDRIIDEDQKRLYDLWLQRKLAEPLSALIMLLMAAPLALQAGRVNNSLRTGALIIMAGFCYFIAERLLLSLGETGYLPALVAVWSPLAIFGLLSLWVLVLLEG